MVPAEIYRPNQWGFSHLAFIFKDKTEHFPDPDFLKKVLKLLTSGCDSRMLRPVWEPCRGMRSLNGDVSTCAYMGVV